MLEPRRPRAAIRAGPRRNRWDVMLELVLFIVAWFVVVNVVLPRLGVSPG